MGPQLQKQSVSSAQPRALAANFAHKPSHNGIAKAKTVVTHTSKAGLNPIADAAAALFALLGKLQQMPHYHNLKQLQQELSQEIQCFQNSAKAQGYSSEQILISRYALCATYDDVICNQSWGANGLWDAYSLLSTFHPDHATPERFFIILERLSKEPGLFIDILELMYLCLSLGFCGPYRFKVSNNETYPNKELCAIIESLYQVIRDYRGDFTKILSPHNIRITAHKKLINNAAILGKTLLLTTGILCLTLMTLGYSLINKLAVLNAQVKTIQTRA